MPKLRVISRRTTSYSQESRCRHRWRERCTQRIIRYHNRRQYYFDRWQPNRRANHSGRPIGLIHYGGIRKRRSRMYRGSEDRSINWSQRLRLLPMQSL